MSVAESDKRLLVLLQRLLDLPVLDVKQTLTGAATAVAQWLDCDKADAFLVDSSGDKLVAVGTSETPLGRLQKELGLDVVAIAGGGRLVETFQTGRSYFTGRADQDPLELSGIVNELGIRSEINVALEIAGTRRGVLSVVTQEPERFDQNDLQVLEFSSRWVATVARHAELSEQRRAEERLLERAAAAEELITVLSHDIRNHLNPLAGRLTLLQKKAHEGQPIEPSLIDSTFAAVGRIAGLTGSLLELARLDRGFFQVQPAPVELCGLVREVREALLTPEVDIQIQAPDELTIVGDADRLRQAFENVLANGIRYSPPGKALRITVGKDSLTRRAYVEVADEGPGVPQELMSKLFDRFVTAPGSTGTGLGLYLAQRIAQAHGGSLQVTSQPDAGARFRFELPIDGTPDGAAATRGMARGLQKE
jgi:two-component system, OmpR family, sensor kinase